MGGSFAGRVAESQMAALATFTSARDATKKGAAPLDTLALDDADLAELVLHAPLDPYADFAWSPDALATLEARLEERIASLRREATERVCRSTGGGGRAVEAWMEPMIERELAGSKGFRAAGRVLEFVARARGEGRVLVFYGD
jgi:hypothetical protein